MIKGSLFITTLLLGGCAKGANGLDAIHADIVGDYPGVSHVADIPANAILLDIREPSEFSVSRLPGAIQVSPDADIAQLVAGLGDISGRPVIAYCSVGRRSSGFAQRAQDQLSVAGAISVSNLENGIFGWHNARGALVNGEGETDVVHPYNELWKRYVVRQSKARYTPESVQP